MYSLGIVGDAFLGIVLTLDTWVYSLISSSYKIFMALASARLLSSDAYTEIANKVYIIVGVGMLFVLAYAILKAIIDPDQLSKGDMAGGKILKSVGIAVVGLIVTPLLFTAAYTVQNKVLEESILSKLFFRTSDSIVDVEGVGSVNYDEMITSTGGAVTATSVWQAFFYPADGVDPNEIKADPDIVRQTANLAAAGCAASIATGIITGIAGFFTGGVAWVITGAAVLSCAGAVIQSGNADRVEQAVGENGEFTLTEAYALVSSGESFAIFQAFLEPISDGDIKYTWLISTVFGAFVAYAFVTYAIDMGTRAAKLAYYQIIAPIPLILQILPKSGDKLSKYVKEVGKTFLDVLVRISIVYIIVYIICHLNELFSTVGALWSNNELSGIETLIAKALLIVGLVLFAKQAPKMIGDTFGLNTGGALDGLNLMKKLREGEVFTAGHVVGGAIRSGVQAGANSFVNNKGKRGLPGRVLGGIGSGLLYGAAGGISAGRDRLKSGKPVGGFGDARNASKKTAAQMQDKRQKWEDFDRVHDTTGKKLSAVGDSVKSSVKRYVYGDVNTSSIDRQAAAYDYMKGMAGKLEGTVGNDAQIKEANRYVADLASYNGAQIYKKTIEDMAKSAEYKTASGKVDYAKIAQTLGDQKLAGRIEQIHKGSDVSSADLNAARDAADERLKIAKKDAVSRKLAEAHISGVDNDTSRMAKQLLSSREFLQYADEFEYLTFDTAKDAAGNDVSITFGQYLRDNFGAKVTKDGTVDFGQMFITQADGGSTKYGIGGTKVIEADLKSTVNFNARDIGEAARTVSVAKIEYKLDEDAVILRDASGDSLFKDASGADRAISVKKLKDAGIQLEAAESTTKGGPSKRTAFAHTKDRGETLGDEFRSDPEYIDRQARKREAEKNDKK